MGIGAELIGWYEGTSLIPDFSNGLVNFSSLSNTAFQFNFSWAANHLLSFIAILFSFLFVDLFDTIGTVVGIADKADLLDDNGELPKLNTQYRNFHISYIIGLFNPKWDEDIESDKKFLTALNLAETIFDEFLKDTFSKIKAKKKVEDAIQSSENNILILDEFMPWKEFLLESKINKAKDINFVIFPSKRGGFNIYAVPKEIGSFENRKSMPKAWRGLRDNKLQEVTGIKTALFCHNAGFIATSKTKEDALKLAKLADSGYSLEKNKNS